MSGDIVSLAKELEPFANKRFGSVRIGVEDCRTIVAAAATITAQAQEIERLREAAMGTMASLAAAISLLERTPASKKAAPSDTMFVQMLADYRKALDTARAALSAKETTGE